MATSPEPQPEPAGQYFIFGPFAYDIDHAVAIIGADPGRATHPVPVAATARTLGVDMSPEEYAASKVVRLMVGEVDEEYARTQADLSVPVILADLRLKDDGSEPAYMLIDGTHRLRRAYVEGVTHLRAYVLTMEEATLIRSDRRLYPRG